MLVWPPALTVPSDAWPVGLARHPSGKLYAAAGYGGGTSYLDSIEMIDAQHPSERGWVAAGRLGMPRAFGAACLGPDQCLYVLGGTDSGRQAFSHCLKVTVQPSHPPNPLLPVALARGEPICAY